MVRMTLSIPKTILAALVLTLVSCGMAGAQMSEQAELQEAARNSSYGLKPALTPASLLDFSKITWSHSYSVSYFSGGSSSGSAGLFQSTALYELSPKLSLSFNFGVSHAGGDLRTTEDAVFLPGFALDYHPSEKFRFTFMIQRVSGYYNPYSYRSSFWNSPWGSF